MVKIIFCKGLPASGKSTWASQYCKDNISNYTKLPFYNKISRNRKIIAWLNYHDLYNVSKI